MFKNTSAAQVWLLKLAGAASDAGVNLNQMFRMLTTTAQNMYSLSVGFTSVVVPSKTSSVQDRASHFETGVGVHGESGKREDIRIYCTPEGFVDPDLLVDHMLKHLESSGARPIKQSPATGETSAIFAGDVGGEDCALMINNLGSLTQLEMALVTSSAVQKFKAMGINVARLMTGRFVTSLDMRGVSMTVLMLDDTRLKFLDRSSFATGFPPLKRLLQGRAPKPLLLHEIAKIKAFRDTTNEGPHAEKVERIIRKVCRALIDAEERINQLDMICGDGDCGLNFKRVAQSLLTSLEAGNVPLIVAEDNTVSPLLFSFIANIFATTAGGSTSGLYHELFSDVTDAFSSIDMRSDKAVASSLWHAVRLMAERKKVCVGMRSMMDALLPANESFKQEVSNEKSIKHAMLAAAVAAEEGAEKTKTMEARVGRGIYMPQKKLEGNMDPGAAAVSAWVRGLADAMAVE
eukprot:GHVN01041198.1.p1 GENE.GHVN01041198.1~~GHVN01041198.1.p1  ORF type:complete len:461 (-),score=48.93 GHVN01041198.1:82-1464(-)